MAEQTTQRTYLTTSNIVWFICLILIVLLIVFPLYIMFKYSIADRASIVTGGRYAAPLWPREPNAAQYKELLGRKDFLIAGFYSLQIAILTVVLSLLIGAPAAFTLARYRFPGLAVLMFSIVSIRLFPDICSVIPVAEAFAKGPLSHIPAFFQVAMAHTLLSLPYVIYICMGVFKTIPRDLEEQAYILGASRFYAFRHVVIPVALSGLSAAAIYVFLLSWNEFIFAYFLLFKSPNVSLPVYLLRILAWTPQLNFLAAISMILSVPVIIFSFAVQRYMISGMTAGAVK